MDKEKILILCALNEELKILNSCLNVKSIVGEYPFKFYHGKFKNLELITAKCGLGKVRTASFTQYCIDNFDFDFLINFGSCGKIDDSLKIGDLIFCTKAIEYDFISLRNFVPEFDCEFEVPDNILEKYRIKKGILLTATQNVDSLEKKLFLKKKYNGDIADWEGSAFAQVCKINKKKFLIFKTVTDEGNENLLDDYRKYFKESIYNSSIKLLNVLLELFS